MKNKKDKDIREPANMTFFPYLKVGMVFR